MTRHRADETLLRWLMCLLFVVFSTTAFAATYYVDATAGSDSANGTATSTPWKSLSKVMYTSFQPGDSILLKRGQVWREQLFIMQSGTMDKPITYGAYGTGNAPVINGGLAVPSWTKTGTNLYAASVAAQPEAVVFSGVAGVRESAASALNAAREWYWAGGTLTVYSTSTPASVEVSNLRFPLEMYQCNYVTVKDLEVRHSTDPVRLTNGNNCVVENVVVHDSAGYAGIILGADTAGRGESNTIRNCTVYNMSGSLESIAQGGHGHGIFVWGSNICRKNTFTGNVCHDNGGGGILLIDSSENVVSNNRVYELGFAGLVLSGLGSNGNIYERNEVYETCHKENDCFGINFYMVGSNNTIRYNIVHDQHVFTDEEVNVPGFTERSGGIRFDGDTWIGVKDKTGNKIHHNIVYNEYEGIQVFNFSRVSIFNNTVYNTVRSGLYCGSYGALGTADGNVWKNNIVHTSQWQMVWHNNATNSVFDNNVYYAPTAPLWNWNGTKVDFATWKQRSGSDALSVVTDPLLVSPSSLDFHLKAQSPCIDRGVAVGLTEDYEGTAIPQGGAPDAGVYETTPVAVPDTTRPVITLSGAAAMTVQAGGTFTDPGATATDDRDGDISARIVVSGAVNAAVVGAYTLSYNVSDTAGNAAQPVSRTVTVVDAGAPVITLVGASSMNVEVGGTFTDPGATATDAMDGNLTSRITVSGSVNVGLPGLYTLTYNVIDLSGNAATPVARTIRVADTQKPVLSLKGASPVTIEAKIAYTDAGATAQDSYEGDISARIVVTGSVNAALKGSYTITYNVSDSSGNAAIPVSRTVNVVDTTKPVITLTGATEVTIEAGGVYSDAGATAQDNYDGNLTGVIVVVNTVNMKKAGVYTVTYNVTDASGNKAAEVKRTVRVVDTQAPVITILD